MLGNFFMLTCPYLFDLETVTYFALFRNYHTSHAVTPITNTTQLFLDTYRHKGDIYVRPIKVQQRYSPTMNMLHVWKDDEFKPVTSSAVKTIYASSMSERALRYRARRGMLDKDEQMALLVMRVSGAMYGRNFFPQAAGVGFSFNPYAWDPEIDPKAGIVRLVFGLGTRAVDRSDDDYTRVVALNAPDKRPEANFDEVKQYAQRRVDCLERGNNYWSKEFFENTPGKLLELLPAAEKWKDVVRVIDTQADEKNRTIHLSANAVEQNVICYFQNL